jgi:hypothetical protein
MVAQVDGLHDTAPIDYEPWQNFQRWLAAGECRVVVPFAEVLSKAIPPVAVRLRRDFGQVLCAIKAHALLHRDQRDRDDVGRIIADIENDYAIVCGLMNAILAEGSGVAINPAMAETVEAVVKATAGTMQAEGASSKEIAKLLKLDNSATWRRLSAACNEGYIANLEQRRRMPGKYRATGQKIEPMTILPTTVELAEQYESSLSLPKSMQSCNRKEKAEISPGDTDCTDDCKPIATPSPIASDCIPIASPLAICMSLDGNEESPPIARLHGFSGESDDFYAFPPVCDHCGVPANPESPVQLCAIEGKEYRLHRACQAEWLNLTIPEFLRRAKD